MIKRYMTLLITTLMLVILTACGGEETSISNSKEKDSKKKDTTTLRLASSGGTTEEFIRHAYTDAYAEQNGIKMEYESPVSLGKLQSLVRSGNINIDIFEVSSAMLEQAIALDLVEELDWDMINPEPIYEEAKSPYGLGYQYFSVVMAWNPDSTNGKQLETWADFWNTDKFPGGRSLPDYPEFAIPVALLADGVPPEELYPIDIDRAFESLDKIKGDVSIWWEGIAQPWQALVSGEIDYAGMFPSAVMDNVEGMEYTYSQALLELAYMVVPKGSKNFDETMKLLHEFTIAENQAKGTEILYLGGPSKNLEPLLPENSKKHIASTEENYKKHVLQNAKWWYENSDEISQRWQEFQLSR